MLKKILYWFPTVFWTIFIGFLCFTPSQDLPSLKLFSYDKIGHLGLFAILQVCLVWGLDKQNPSYTYHDKHLKYAWLFCFGYSLIIEIAQANWIPGRKGDWADFTFDIIGCSLAYLFYKKWGRKHLSSFG